MPELIQRIQAILQSDQSFKPPISPADLMRAKENELRYAQNEAGEIIGLNFYKSGLTTEKWQKICALPGLKQSLQFLQLAENQLTVLDFSADFKNLRELNLAENKPLRRLSFSAPLPLLERLDASECRISEFKLPDGFSNLKWLDLRKTGLKKLDLCTCPALEAMDLSENGLTSFHLPEGFKCLKYIFLQKNELQKFNLGGRCPALQILNLQANQLREFDSPQLNRAPNLQTLYLHGNPLPEIPVDILGGENANCLPDLQSFFRSFQKSDARFLHQAKLVLIGNGEVGKSSIRIKLLDKNAPLPQKNDRTPGLDIAPYAVEDLPIEITNLTQAIDFQLNIWDFGGQGKYREVQQLFCTRKTLYLFVTAHDDTAAKKKEDYVGFEYWMSMVNAYSFDTNDERFSPVVFVVNKIDEQEMGVNEADCQQLFGNLVGFVKISCQTLKNFGQLESKIRESLPTVSRDIFTDRFSEFWMNVKTELERRQPEKHLVWQEYLKICADHNLDEQEAISWIRVLDRIGTVIYFGRHSQLENWIVLDPKWVNKAFCDLIDSKSAVGGTLKPTDFEIIWDEKTYSDDEREHLKKLLLAYELAYERTDALGFPQFVVPCLLPATVQKLPEVLQKPDFKLKLEFKPFVPAGTVNKLMVRLNALIFNNLMWQGNVVFSDEALKTFAHVREDWQSKSIFIELQGERCADLFQKIKSDVEAVNQNLKNTRFIQHLEFEVWGEKNGKWRTLEDWAEIGQPFFPSKKAAAGASIFFSYAWGDDKETTAESREKIVDRLYDELKTEGFDLRRDKKDIGYKGLISEFMKQIGRGKAIVVVISKKYLHSPYCMFELLEIYRKSNSDLEEFRQKIYPIVLEDAKIFGSSR